LEKEDIMGKAEKGFIDVKKLAKILENSWYHNMKDRGGFICWDGRFTKEVTKQYKVSICTTCMDRLSDLKQTLPQNIQDNLDYPNVEFVVLDYNSKKDDVAGWIKSEMMEHITSGKLVYYRTKSNYPYFDMSHSRNVVFLAASGDIVNNVDADAFTPSIEEWGFATYINKLANEQPEKAIFAKSRQLLRGRLGFFKKEFIEILGGYDETLKGYGNDDANLQNRAWELNFKMMSFRGRFCGIVPDHIKHQEGNYKEEWWKTEGKNRLISYTNLIVGNFVANEGRSWGKARLIKNFNEETEVGVNP